MKKWPNELIQANTKKAKHLLEIIQDDISILRFSVTVLDNTST